MSQILLLLLCLYDLLNVLSTVSDLGVTLSKGQGVGQMLF